MSVRLWQLQGFRHWIHISTMKAYIYSKSILHFFKYSWLYFPCVHIFIFVFASLLAIDLSDWDVTVDSQAWGLSLLLTGHYSYDIHIFHALGNRSMPSIN